MQDEKKPLKNAGTPRNEGVILPQEPVDVYATSSIAGQHLGKHGTKHTVHAVLAKQLVDKGAATFEKTAAPKNPVSRAKLSDSDLKEVSEKLGRKPTAEEINALEIVKGLSGVEKPAKEVKLTKAEIKALSDKLGHEPTEEEIASAIEEKEALA